MPEEKPAKGNDRNKKTILVKEFRQLRELLRCFFMYGCRTVDDFERMGIKSSSFNQTKSKLLSVIDHDKYIIVRCINGKKAVQFRTDMFEQKYNYMCRAYSLCSRFHGSTAGTMVIALQLMNSSKGRPVSLSRVMNELDQLSTGNEKGHTAAARNALSTLASCGLIRRSGREYVLTADIFAGVSDPVLFLDFLAFCRNIVPPYTCGNMLFETALDYFRRNGSISGGSTRSGRGAPVYSSPFTINGSHLNQVLDDETMWTLINAMTENRVVKLTYLGRSTAAGELEYPLLYPLKLVSDREFTRRYLFAFDAAQGRCIFLRLDRIVRADISDETFEPQQYAGMYDEAVKDSFSGVTVPRGEKHTVTLKASPEFAPRLMALFPECTVTHDETGVTAVVTLNNYREIKPWLRKNMTAVRAVGDSPLAAEMDEELTEWRKLYGIV